RLMCIEVAGDAFFGNERVLFDDTASQWHGELLATRGERLALLRVWFLATVDGSGPREVEALDLVEVDAAGRRTALVVFDPEDLDAAHAELDARFTAAEAAAHRGIWAAFARVTRLINARDWTGLEAVLAPTQGLEDHRVLRWGAALADRAA